MKLYPIMYLHEGMRTPEEALEKGIAAIAHKYATSVGGIVLLSTKRTLKYVQKNKALDGLEQRAVVASINYRLIQGDLYKINYSAGVSDFGPLAYQMVMQEIMKTNNGWLASDENLKKASKRVWQKMYELSEQGVYKRKWLGDWDIGGGDRTRHPFSRRTHLGQDSSLYYEGMKDKKYDGSEADFLKYLSEHNVAPYEYGWLWAYQLQSFNPKFEELYEKGEELLLQIEQIIKGVRINNVRNVLLSGENFFGRMYHS